MRPFEYAEPRTETEAVELLNEPLADRLPSEKGGATTALLAGGLDLYRLMRRDLLAPKRVVNLREVPSLHGVRAVEGGVMVGALTTLEDAAKHPLLAGYKALLQAIAGVRAIQVQSSGTIGGDLCHLPNCWYFRNGYGLLAMQDGESLVETGDNRYHAILGNHGPAKFVSATRFAPGLIAWGAKVRLLGPKPDQEEWLPLEYLYQTPKTNTQGVTVLKPGQIITHVWLPAAPSSHSGSPNVVSATYDVMQLEGLDWPLAAASAVLDLTGGVVRDARIVLGHVAPTPWVSVEAARALLGRSVSEESAQAAGDAAVVSATPLSNNEYKVQLARTAVKRAILRAAGQLEEGV